MGDLVVRSTMASPILAEAMADAVWSLQGRCKLWRRFEFVKEDQFKDGRLIRGAPKRPRRFDSGSSALVGWKDILVLPEMRRELVGPKSAKYARAVSCGAAEQWSDRGIAEEEGGVDVLASQLVHLDARELVSLNAMQCLRFDQL